MTKPYYRPNEDSPEEDYKALENVLPSITWGYGHSPIFKNKCYATIVIAWGPLIQMYILNDLRSKTETFIADGFHIIEPDHIV